MTTAPPPNAADDDSPTNVFVREASGWRMVHHHAGPIASGIDDDSPPELLN